MSDIPDPIVRIPRSLVIERPWPLPRKDQCWFYHYIDLPGGETLTGEWDFRGHFEQYVGRYPIVGKTVLDVGTAGGFLSFAAEQTGATVTGMDCRHAIEFDRIPFGNALHHTEWRDWLPIAQDFLSRMQGGFWYAWHKLGSRVQMSYTPLVELSLVDDRFDVVFAGAIIEHLADPVSAIGRMARVAKEAVIIAFTDVGNTDELTMQTMNPWRNPEWDHSWWILSRGLYKRVFENLGFEVTIVPATARRLVANQWQEVARYTIIAQRVRDGSS
jgi:SAM-dependent methyltransferase